jgi:hypothetical protein
VSDSAKKLIDAAWSATYEEIKDTSLKILREAGDESYQEVKPFLENICKWSADLTIGLAQDDPEAPQYRKMLVHQLELIGIHLTHKAREAFQKALMEDLLIVARVLGAILKQVLVP